MKSSVRLGASASFVSADGLVITNHHVGRGHLQRLSTADKNYARDGFHARTRAEELKVPGLSVTVLQSIEDVTARVNAGIPSGAAPEAAAAARRKVYADIGRESLGKTGLQSNVGILFDGNRQSLSRTYAYEEDQGRSISVHSAAIIEALEKVYGATSLVAELRRTGAKGTN